MEKSGRVTSVEAKGNGTRVTVLMSDKVPKVGDSVRIKWGRKRTSDQNALYWQYLTDVLFEAGLSEKAGYVTTDEFHADLAGHFLTIREKSKQGVMIYRVRSTTELDIVEFHDYMEKVDLMVNTFFEINTSQFWDDYNDLHSKHRS